MSQNPTFPYTILQWTSRAEVCERLHRFLLETPPGDSQDVPFDPTHRVRAGELLALLDDLPGSLYRMALLRRSDEEPWLQRVTLESLLASDAVVSPQALLQLLTSQTVSNQSGELLNLCRTPELVESVRGWIQTNSIAGCANLLASVNVPWVHAWGWPWWGEDVKPPQAVLDLLYEGCFRVDAVQGSQEILQPDAYVTMAAALMADRPEARAFLERHWTDRSAWTFEALGPLVAWHPECLGSLLSAGAPPLRDFPLEVLQLRGMRLDQPEPAARALIQHYGTGEL
ncbi:MAG: hypothetical protein K0Q72_1977, partial [Armatimonadetes bacterium]|nr:hypothetical protein [Armatimonadota bacterium]